MYKLTKNLQGQVNGVETQQGNLTLGIPFIDGNTDYANFKTAILEDKAQLQDAEGNTMTAEQAKDFIKELP
jgi:hypothetical protein